MHDWTLLLIYETDSKSNMLASVPSMQLNYTLTMSFIRFSQRHPKPKVKEVKDIGCLKINV